MEESLDIFAAIQSKMNLKTIDIANYSGLTLAYIGDAIYEVLIRTLVVTSGNMPVNKLHHKSSSMVCAKAQAEMITKLLDYLTEEEIAVYKRGRNSKSATMAKNASMIDYRNATGFEALIGYLYLTKNTERMIQIVTEGLKRNEI